MCQVLERRHGGSGKRSRAPHTTLQFPVGKKNCYVFGDARKLSIKVDLLLCYCSVRMSAHLRPMPCIADSGNDLWRREGLGYVEANPWRCYRRLGSKPLEECSWIQAVQNLAGL